MSFRERAIEFVQQGQPLFPGASFGQSSEPGLGVMLRQGRRRQLIDKTVEADAPGLRQVPQTLVFTLRNPNRQCAHASSLLKSLGVKMRRSGKRRSEKRKSAMLLVTIAAAPPATASSRIWLSPSSRRLGRHR